MMLEIRWYGVMYVLAFWIAWALLPYLAKKRGVTLSRDRWTSIVAWGALGIVVGGRLGYGLLYDPHFFLANPGEIFKIWHGGMSSHGGFIGAALGVWWAARSLPLLSIADVISIPAALGLALGRIGNLTNKEFGMYPMYEAIADLCIAGICYVLFVRWKGKPGTVFSLFLILYGIARFLLEYLRPQEWSQLVGLTRGQLYTIPLFVIGCILYLRANRNDRVT